MYLNINQMVGSLFYVKNLKKSGGVLSIKKKKKEN